MICHTSTSLLLWAVTLAGLTQSRPTDDQHILQAPTVTPTPLVIWQVTTLDLTNNRHGLGDTAHAEGIEGFIQDIKHAHPGIFVHSVQIPEGGSLDDERKAGFFGLMSEQGDEGCKQIKGVKELEGGFDAMGFSQGGLYLRHYAQYCDGPPIHNLITFGTPHYGISALLPCPTPPTLSCLLAARAARVGIYTSYAQTHLVQAQYYRDAERLDEFMSVNEFLRDLNAEKKGSGEKWTEKEKGGRGLGGLNKLIAVMFDADRTVSPAQSAHFATYTPGNKTLLIPMEDQPLYTQDWIGLRELDEKRGLWLEHCPGEHMDLDTGDCGMNMVMRWVGWAR